MRKFAIFDFVYSLASANIDQSVPNLATIHMPIRARMSSIMGQIEPEHRKLIALEFGKIAESDFVYTLASTNIHQASTNIHQSAPNLVKMYLIIKISDEFEYGFNRTRSIQVICPWIWKNCWIWLDLHPSIYKCRPISAKYGHNMYDNNILDEFGYGSNLTVTSGVFCPWTRKNCLIWLCLHSSIYK